MSSSIKVAFGVLILAVVVLRTMRGNYKGIRRMWDSAFLGFAGVYLIVAGILGLLGKA
jgi:hypothetical protein